MAAAKKKKMLTYRGKPIYRVGNRIYYGNLEDQLILVMDITETEKVGEYDVAKKVEFHIQDNTELLTLICLIMRMFIMTT